MRMPPPLSRGIFDFFPGVVPPAVRFSATASREASKSAHAQFTSEDTTGVRKCVVHLSGNQNNSNKLLSEEAMPLFGNTFSPKKTPPRKSASLSNLHMLDRSSREIELGLEYGTPVMTLTGQSMRFENGQWIAESFGDTGDRREANRLRKRIQQLEEENNLLQLKIDILLDMLSETTAESHLMQKEMEELKNYSRKRK
ncbi:protein chibby homolog 1 isoform X3 [Podarcis muralis]